MKKTTPTFTLINWWPLLFLYTGMLLISIVCFVKPPWCLRTAISCCIHLFFLIRLSIPTSGTIPHDPNGWLYDPFPSTIRPAWFSCPTCRVLHGLPIQPKWSSHVPARPGSKPYSFIWRQVSREEMNQMMWVYDGWLFL